MKFSETSLVDAWLIDLEPIEDRRGFFARTWCHREAAEHGIEVDWVQCNVSHNKQRGTLRGMHWQAPDSEAKLVRVTRGAILDVIVDIRRHSPTFRQFFSVELTDANRRALFVPEGFAHGFMTLADDTEVFYQMSAYFVPGQARGFRYDDPEIGIPWPDGPRIVSERDAELPGFAA
jgi:dTDP-4-dehydrorhamnose 3,5-epimerase